MNKKIRKFISKGLIVSTLFVNISINSFAETLLENTRYETFEGFNITVNDVLECGNADVGIDGGTVVNLLGDMDNLWNKIIKKRDQYQYIDGDLIIPNNEYFHGWGWQNVGAIPNIKGNTTYTLFFSKNATPRMEFGCVDDKGVGKSLVTHRNVNKVAITAPSNGDLRIKFCVQNPTPENNPLNLGKVMLLEGDWTDKEMPEYFEGIRSVGELEQNKLEVISRNINLFEGEYELGGTTYGSNAGMLYEDMKVTSKTRIRLKELIKIEPGETYTVKLFDAKSLNLNFGFQFYDKDKKGLNIEPARTSTFMKYLAPSNAEYVNIFVGTIDDTDISISEYSNLKVMLVKSNQEPVDYIAPKISSKEIRLKEPLRGLPNGTRDKIVKKDGKWYIERNCKEIILSESSGSWGSASSNNTTNYNRFILIPKIAMKSYSTGNKVNIIADKLRFMTADELVPNDVEGVSSRRNNNSGGIILSVKKDEVRDISDLKEWLLKNNISIVYELKNPIYEPLNITSSIETYMGTTYISSNSLMPTSLKVVIDRVANRAKEYSESAMLSPTTENLSLARMWINLMKDSILKDSFQVKINDITQIDDLELEKKTATANLDIYIKSENLLSMSLDTNLITFDDYSGIDEMEKLKAINISINSSLPYSLNAYMPSEIKNINNSKTMDLSVLNIKESSENTYKIFDSISSKLILKDDCVKGNGKYHSIDLKLASDLAHEADMYKTILKFEVEQK